MSEDQLRRECIEDNDRRIALVLLALQQLEHGSRMSTNHRDDTALSVSRLKGNVEELRGATAELRAG